VGWTDTAGPDVFVTVAAGRCPFKVADAAAFGFSRPSTTRRPPRSTPEGWRRWSGLGRDPVGPARPPRKAPQNSDSSGQRPGGQPDNVARYKQLREQVLGGQAGGWAWACY
jgi:hypothetical protein